MPPAATNSSPLPPTGAPLNPESEESTQFTPIDTSTGSLINMEAGGESSTGESGGQRLENAHASSESISTDDAFCTSRSTRGRSTSPTHSDLSFDDDDEDISNTPAPTNSESPVMTLEQAREQSRLERLEAAQNYINKVFEAEYKAHEESGYLDLLWSAARKHYPEIPEKQPSRHGKS